MPGFEMVFRAPRAHLGPKTALGGEMSGPKTALVISAHAADFVWRCGGAIALHQKLGYEVTVACLSYGERGESARLWKEGKTLDEVKAIRRREAEAAAQALDVHDIRFFDLGDYPLVVDHDAKMQLVDLIRAVQPRFMMSHSKYDPYNTDHMYTTEVALEVRMIAQAWGHNPGQKVLGAPQLYLFEPHQTEQMGWKPDTFLDITEVWDQKRAAIECMEGQHHLWDFYTNVAENRGNHFRRNSGGQAAAPSRCTKSWATRSRWPAYPMASAAKARGALC
jgi:4-oxalomesaconate hydratase